MTASSADDHNLAPGDGDRETCTGDKARRLADASLLQIRRGPRASLDEVTDGDASPAGSRRDFLSLMGFSLGAAGLSACRAPVQHAVPLPVASPEMIPGVSLSYATTCGGCPAACSLLVKQRDGRPIKIEGNAESSLFGGGSCATGQATVLSLYDGRRFRGPRWLGAPVSWPEIDRRVTAALAASGRESSVVLLSGTITSPSTREVIAAFAAQNPNFSHITADPMPLGALREATGRVFARAVVPHFRFDRARVVVALEADFLGTWLSPVEFAHAYSSARRNKSPLPLHVQIESGYSVTGSNADTRIAVAPSQLGAVAAALFARVARRAGVAGAAPLAADGAAERVVPGERLDAIASALWEAGKDALVVSGSADLSTQLVVAGLNALLGNEGHTVDVQRPSLQRQGDNGEAMAGLIARMAAGQVGVLIVHGINPAYDHPQAAAFAEALGQVPLSISLADRPDETTARVTAICPDHHFLESWGDAEPVSGHLSLAQPLIAPLFGTRAAPESLLRWLGEEITHYDHVRGHWRRQIAARQGRADDFDTFWDQALQRGVSESAPGDEEAAASSFRGDTGPALTAALDLLGDLRRRTSSEGAPALELHTFESVALRDGRHADNPWLQELPDPITRTSWGNVAAVAPALAQRMGLVAGDIVALAVGDRQIQLPVFVQAGQHPGTVSVALGYGRRAAGSAGSDVGADAFRLSGAQGPLVLSKTGQRVLLPNSQPHLSMEGRDIALVITPEELQRQAAATTEEELPTLWAPPPTGAHKWGLSIDLDACTGCSACVVACQAENNVPVVGKDQVQRNRIMHWLRIDRYFEGPADDPQSLHQPMMCQHCAHAPCETVCPVLATTTSSDGLNQQVYNRCIGTRYCANNCPYKVRRFNWLEYTKAGPHAVHMEDPLGRLVLNPDVTVRTRGVMEKCSLCVQRIALAKNQALQQRRELRDGDVQTACQQSCPTGAIVFGDLMDPGSQVSRLHASARAYQVLSELGTRPNVAYLKRVRAPQKAPGSAP